MKSSVNVAIRSLLPVGICVLSSAHAPTSVAASAAGYNSYERQALQVVHDWDEAWKSKDAQKIARYMSSDVVIDGTTPGTTVKGQDAFIAQYNDPKTGMRGIDYYQVVARFAAGDSNQTVVVEKRRDHVTINGKHVVLPFVGYFHVKGGKIVEWHDVDIAPFPPGLLPPPPAGGPAGGPPPAPGT